MEYGVHSVGVKTIYLGYAIYSQVDDVYLRELLMIKIAFLDKYRF